MNKLKLIINDSKKILKYFNEIIMVFNKIIIWNILDENITLSYKWCIKSNGIWVPFHDAVNSFCKCTSNSTLSTSINI